MNTKLRQVPPFHLCASCNVFKRVNLKFIRPEPNQVFNVESCEGLKFLTRISLGLSHLADHKFRHNFQDCVICSCVICSCSQEIETWTHFLLHCSNYHCARQTLFKKINKIDSTTLRQTDQVTTKLLPFGNEKVKFALNKSVLTSTIEFIQSTKIFKISLLD